MSAAWVLLPHSGSDLAAQVAHANFFSHNGWFPIDMRWFGGTDMLGYSVLGPRAISFLGVPLAGALSTVIASGLCALALTRCKVPHPRLGALVVTGCLVGNLVAGRLTFALGACVGIATLLALWMDRRLQTPLLVVGTVLTWALSPLAALFLAMVGAALFLRGRRAAGAALVITTGLLMLATAGIGQDGIMPIAGWDVVRGVVACAMVAVVTRYPVVRIVAAISATSLVAAYFVASPVGVNALRFPALFAVPIALATSRFGWKVLLPVGAALVSLAPPFNPGDVTMADQPANHAAYFAPLNHELTSLPITGRVEVVPTYNRWEATYVAAKVPLARGWMTQVDRAHNPLFFAPTLRAGRYYRWLRNNAVQYVALSDSQPSAVGVNERKLVLSHPSYLALVWRTRHWQLYAVAHPTTTVTGARLLSQDGTHVAFFAPSAGTVLVRVQWSQWLTLKGPGACLVPGQSWTQIRVTRPGRYLLSSNLVPGRLHRVCQPAT
ncbi:MAG: hypothetical protein ACRDQ1_10630 [Sciscionella sp.]